MTALGIAFALAAAVLAGFLLGVWFCAGAPETETDRRLRRMVELRGDGLPECAKCE